MMFPFESLLYLCAYLPYTILKSFGKDWANLKTFNFFILLSSSFMAFNHSSLSGRLNVSSCLSVLLIHRSCIVSSFHMWYCYIIYWWISCWIYCCQCFYIRLLYFVSMLDIWSDFLLLMSILALLSVLGVSIFI